MIFSANVTVRLLTRTTAESAYDADAHEWVLTPDRDIRASRQPAGNRALERAGLTGEERAYSFLLEGRYDLDPNDSSLAVNEFSAMLQLEETLKPLQLPYVSLGKKEPDAPEFLAGYFVSDTFLTRTLQGPACNISRTRVQVVAFAISQKRAFELAVQVRETLEAGPFERVGNASVLQRDKRIGVSRDYLFRW